ncbi:hypothetical protein [Curtobacterium sp. NPDC089689]|uniref:hypothetical protein n=1 Tax=Curtobacterium sp. NPDC089689 TaxID=3363968 RepID=UPI0037F3EED4
MGNVDGDGNPTGPVRSIRDAARRTLTAVLVVVAALTLLRYGALSLGATEGDVPAASVVELPSGSEVVDDDVECASGGCWRLLTVRPPSGSTANDLADTLSDRVDGTLWDPRVVNLSSEIDEGFLVVRADYWSQSTGPRA